MENGWAEEVKARKTVDGIMLIPEERWAFKKITDQISFQYKPDFVARIFNDRHAMDEKTAVLYIGGFESGIDFTPLEAILKKYVGVNDIGENKFSRLDKTVQGEIEGYIIKGTPAKNLATILARNGIEFQGSEHLERNGLGGERTI